jgi:hypothetical protein
MPIGLKRITPIVTAATAVVAIATALTVAAADHQAQQSCVISGNSTDCRTAGDVKINGSVPALPLDGYILGLRLAS